MTVKSALTGLVDYSWGTGKDINIFRNVTDYLNAKIFGDTYSRSWEGVDFVNQESVFVLLPFGPGWELQDPSVPATGLNSWVQNCGFRISFDGINWLPWQHLFDGGGDSTGLSPYYNNPTFLQAGGTTWISQGYRYSLPPGDGLRTVYCQYYAGTWTGLPVASPPGWDGSIVPTRVSDMIWFNNVMLLITPPSLSFTVNDGATTAVSGIVKLTVDAHVVNDLAGSVTYALSNDNIHWGNPNICSSYMDSYYVFYNRSPAVLTTGPGLTTDIYWDCTVAYWDSSVGSVMLSGSERTIYMQITDPAGNVTYAQQTITLVYPTEPFPYYYGLVGVYKTRDTAAAYMQLYRNSFYNGTDTGPLRTEEFLPAGPLALVLPNLTEPPPMAYRLSLDLGTTWSAWQPWAQSGTDLVYPITPIQVDGPLNIFANFAWNKAGHWGPLTNIADLGSIESKYYEVMTWQNTLPILLVTPPTVEVTVLDRDVFNPIVSLDLTPHIAGDLDRYFFISMSNNGIKWGSPWGGIVSPDQTWIGAQFQEYTLAQYTYSRYVATITGNGWPVMPTLIPSDTGVVTVSWDCSDGYSSQTTSKTIYLRIMDRAGNISSTWSQTVTLNNPAVASWFTKVPLTAINLKIGKSSYYNIQAANLVLGQYLNSYDGIWACNILKGTNSFEGAWACLASLRSGVAQTLSGTATAEIQIKRLTNGAILDHVATTQFKEYTISVLQRLGISEVLLGGATMAILGGYIDRILSAMSTVQINRNDSFAVTERLQDQTPGDNPILLPTADPPVALLQGLYNQVTKTTVVVKVSGANVTQYTWSLDTGAVSAPVAATINLTLSELSPGSHTLVVRGGTVTGVWQVTPTTMTFTVDLAKAVTFDSYGIPKGFDGMHADAGGGSMAIRKIALSVNPYEVTDYSLDMQLASGTFSYSGLLTTVPAAKSVVTLQGIHGTVQRVGPSANRSKPGYSVEGRLLPVFTSEFIYLHFPDRHKNIPYFVLDILEEIESQSGASVTFTALNNRLGSFEFSGRFTDALTQLAELACGELIQQNGKWFIAPKGTVLGSFTVPKDDIISVSQVNQTDLFDQVYALFQARRDTVVELERLKLSLNNTTGTGLAKTYRSLANVNFAFGKKGKDNFSPIPAGILVEDATTWETYSGTSAPSSNYFKTEPVLGGGMRGLVGTDGTGGGNGEKYLFGVKLMYKVNLPADASGLYRARGTLNNITAPFWAGSETNWWALTPTVRTALVAENGGASSILTKELFFEFNTMLSSDPNWTETRFWSCDLEIEYKPNSNAAPSSAVNQQNALTDKLACIDREIARLGYGGLTSQLQIANMAWSQYYIREGQKALIAELDSLNAAAVTADRAVVTRLVSLNPIAKLINISMLYNGVMPLPANGIILSGTIPNSGLATDCGRVEQISFNGYQVNITARKV